jgi:hypothetical protein
MSDEHSTSLKSIGSHYSEAGDGSQLKYEYHPEMEPPQLPDDFELDLSVSAGFMSGSDIEAAIEAAADQAYDNALHSGVSSMSWRVHVRALTHLLDIHERRYFDPEEIRRLEPIVRDPALHLPVKVVSTGDFLAYADSMLFCKALLATDSDAMVEVVVIDEDECTALRHANSTSQATREPMAMSRHAWNMIRSELYTKERILTFFNIGEAAFEQMVQAAETEMKFYSLGALLIKPYETPPSFWTSVYETRLILDEMDKSHPFSIGPSRAENLIINIAMMVDKGIPISVEEVSERLGLIAKRETA